MQDMSNCLDSLAILTVESLDWVRHEAWNFWYFGNEGIKRSKTYDRWNPEESTDQSAKEILRYNKVCEWLDNYFRRNPAERKPRSQGGWLEGGRLVPLLDDLTTDVEPRLEVNVSNLPGDLNDIFSWAVTRTDIDDHKEFLLILVVLSFVYGGIHLATWNFAFASKTEHLLWKIACIDIMATVPIGVLCILRLGSLIDPFKPGRSYRKDEFMWNLYTLLYWAIFYLLLVPYVLSRIYIVVESFIGLRHVPIGVYAAVPWVQAIPHV